MDTPARIVMVEGQATYLIFTPNRFPVINSVNVDKLYELP